MWSEAPSAERMSESDQAEKGDDYTPGYLSTNREFDPQTASFFYESGDCAQPAASSTSSQHAVIKVETPEKASKLAPIKEEQPSPPTQRVPSKEYLAAQRQYQQNLLQRQQYFLASGALSQDQKEYLLRRGSVPPSQIPSRVPHPAPSLPTQGYARAPVYPPQQNVPPSNVPYSIVLPPRAAGTRGPPIPQRIPAHMVVQPRYPSGVPTPHPYVPQRMHMRPGVQYANVPVRYSSQISHLPPQGTIVYTQDGRPIPMQHAQFTYAPVPMEYIQGPPVVYDNSPNFQREQLSLHFYSTSFRYSFKNTLADVIVKEEPIDPEEQQIIINVEEGRKKRRLRKAKMAEGEGVDDVGTKRRRTGKRKKGENGADAEASQQADANPDAPPPPLTHGELLKQKKRNMAFPKGTFLVRYADLDSSEYAGHIWLVDNHQLLQKYTYDGLDASSVKVFSRTERYSGWLCTCPWLYHPLSDVKNILGNMEKVSITNYPTRDELFARREEEKLKAPEPEPEPEHTEEAQETAHSDADHSGGEHDLDEQENEEAEELPLFKTESDELPVIKVEEPDTK
ncbi:hypothetical protein ANCCAN_08079 [Ancylostoma caninum]|uniref:Uncharacterized protein n=1 Tax=Ancylostoma caninum TaxID=29170 RepID=A0A368GNL3_ANCCA|nr:hypothetical protein ANCCAN_08079 [Ancylostoma caninum]